MIIDWIVIYFADRLGKHRKILNRTNRDTEAAGLNDKIPGCCSSGRPSKKRIGQLPEKGAAHVSSIDGKPRQRDLIDKGMMTNGKTDIEAAFYSQSPVTEYSMFFDLHLWGSIYDLFYPRLYIRHLVSDFV